MSQQNVVRVGIGLIIENAEGKVLMGRRKSALAPHYSMVGGHIEVGESFEEAIIREAREETGLEVHSVRFVCVTNDLGTYEECGKHYVSIIMHTNDFSGEPQTMEPDKQEGWAWHDPKHPPMPHFDASLQGLACFLEGKPYCEHDYALVR